MFLKLFHILAVTVALHFAATSPNPPPRREERLVEPTKVEAMLTSLYLRNGQKAIFWLLGLCEIIVTVVLSVAPKEIQDDILPVLTFGGHVADLRTTPSIFFTIGASLIIAGSGLRVWCYRELGSQFTFELGLLKDHRLITTGPYRVVRHPSYSGALVVYLGLLIYYASPGTWTMECLVRGNVGGQVFSGVYGLIMVFFAFGLVSRIGAEDAGLRAKFGDQWDDWAAETYAIVPFVY